MNFIRDRFRVFTSTKEKKALVGNFFSLSFLQVANYIFPLITLPYLVRVLGVEKFGLVAFAQAFIQYFVVLTDYSFSLSATRAISVNRQDRQKLSEIFSSVTVIKLCCMFLSFIILCTIVFLVPKFRQDWVIYLFSFGLIFDSVLFPVWFFQGMEEMHYITSRNIAAKLIFTLAILIFIKDKSDYIYVPLINSLGFIAAGLISLRPLFFRFQINFVFPTLNQVKCQLSDGMHIFISKIAINLYTTTNTFVLGLFTNNMVVGYYAAGEKIVRVAINMFNPIFQATYPHFAKSAMESRDKTIEKMKKLLRLTVMVSAPLFVLFIVFANQIVQVLLGPKFLDSVIVVRILSPLLVIIPFSFIFANLGLLSFKLDRYFLGIYVFGAILNIILLAIFLGLVKLGSVGSAWSNVITEIVLAFVMFFVLKASLISGRANFKT